MMRILALVPLLCALAAAAPPKIKFKKASSDPQSWKPENPPPAAEQLPGYGQPANNQSVLLIPDPNDKGDTANLTQPEIAGWQWPAYLAAAANCDPYKIRNWKCGVNCDKAGPVNIVTSDGDNKATPWWYVGWSGPTAVVAIKGTNTDSLKSLLNDAKFAKEDADEVTVPRDGRNVSAFPNCDGAEVHTGFMDVFQHIQPQVDAGVREAFAHNATRILVVGHSLGAAIGQITAVYLQQEYPNVTVSARLFGLPRVGDGDWADCVDKTLGNRSLFMVNGDDMVPHLPPKIINYRQASGEVWLKDNASDWEWCKGQDNDHCSDSVTGEFSSKHDGPYAGIYMACDPQNGKDPVTLTSTNWTDTGLVNGG